MYCHVHLPFCCISWKILCSFVGFFSDYVIKGVVIDRFRSVVPQARTCRPILHEPAHAMLHVLCKNPVNGQLWTHRLPLNVVNVA